MDLLEDRSKKPLHVTYRAVGSSTGQKEFLGDPASNYQAYNHFGAGDIPMSSSRWAELTSHGREMVHVPFAMGAIGVFHSVPVAEMGARGYIDLDGCLLAKIFSRQITNWAHPEIRALNPDLTATAEIRVYHRDHGSSSTSGITEYMSGKCPASWTLGSGSTITWPQDTFSAQGSGGMSSALETTAYGIAYIDAGHGHGANLAEIKLENADGEYLSSLDADISAAGTSAINANVIPNNPAADFSNVNLYDQPGNLTWPITMMSYFYVPKDLTHMDPASASVLVYFLNFILSDEGQDMAETYKFAKLPAALRTYNTATLGLLILPTGFETYETELASTTLPWLGAKSNYMSGKRRGHTEVALDSLEARIEALETQLAPAAAFPTSDGSAKVVQMHGAGTTNPSKLFWEVMDLLEDRSKKPLHVTYRAVGSSTGQKEFLGDPASNYQAYNHFGAGDIPMSSSRWAELTSHGREMVHVPFAMGAIGVFHSVPVAEMGARGYIDLDGCLLAKIFSRQITNWAHPEIRALNPDLTATAEIRVYHRDHGSSSTSGITEYMSGKCPASWTLGSGSTITWPQDTFSAQGSGGMSSALETTAYGIAYIDAGHGHGANLAEIKLENADGEYLSSLDADISAAGTSAINANVIPNNPAADFSNVNLYDQPGNLTWPITMMSYFYVPKDLTHMDPASASVLVYFLNFILSDEGQDMAETYKFAKLPAALRTYNTATLGLLILPTGFETYETELASTTLPWLGAKSNYMSGKRRDHTEGALDSLEARVDTLDAAGEIRTEKLTCISSYCFSEQELASIAVAGFVCGIVSLVIGLVGFCLALCALRRSVPNVHSIVNVRSNENASVSASSTSAASTSAEGKV